jgi:YgiT-type zinc finger domain-containing protein
MKCAICKQGETQQRTITLRLKRAGASVFVKEITAQVCDHCGETYLSEKDTAQILAEAGKIVQDQAPEDEN